MSDPLEPVVGRVQAADQVRVDIGEVPGVERAPPTPEEVRLANEVFAQKNQEADTVAGILGFWTSGMILKDFIEDAIRADSEEEERPRKKEERPKE